MGKIIWIIVILIIIIGGVMLFRGGVEAPAGETNTPAPPGEVTTPVATTPSVKEFAVTGTPFKFSVAEMRVKKGDTVKIVFTNGSGKHDWKIDEFNAATKVLDAGQSETITFVADKTGTFEYYCSVGTHRQLGMKGNLIVE